MDDNVRDIYSNSISIGSTDYEFSFDFNLETIKIDAKGTSPGKDVANVVKVRMSPQLAKAFSDLLAQHVDQYEKEHMNN